MGLFAGRGRIARDTCSLTSVATATSGCLPRRCTTFSTGRSSTQEPRTPLKCTSSLSSQHSRLCKHHPCQGTSHRCPRAGPLAPSPSPPAPKRPPLLFIPVPGLHVAEPHSMYRFSPHIICEMHPCWVQLTLNNRGLRAPPHPPVKLDFPRT